MSFVKAGEALNTNTAATTASLSSTTEQDSDDEDVK